MFLRRSLRPLHIHNDGHMIENIYTVPYGASIPHGLHRRIGSQRFFVLAEMLKSQNILSRSIPGNFAVHNVRYDNVYIRRPGRIHRSHLHRRTTHRRQCTETIPPGLLLAPYSWRRRNRRTMQTG